MINVPTEHFNQILNPLLLNIIFPKHLYNPLHGNVLIIIPCYESKGIPDIPEIVLTISDFEGLHELFESDFLVNVEHLGAELGEVLGRDVVADALEYVLEVFFVDLALFRVHVEDLEESLALGGLKLEFVGGDLLACGLVLHVDWLRLGLLVCITF